MGGVCHFVWRGEGKVVVDGDGDMDDLRLRFVGGRGWFGVSKGVVE